MESEPENSDNSALEEDRSGLETRKGLSLVSNVSQRVKREESSGVESSSEEDEDEEEEEEESSSCEFG